MAVTYTFDSEEPARAVRVADVSERDDDAPSRIWQGEWASEFPLNTFHICQDGGGANGSAGYLALPVQDAPEFYAESTPYWWETSTTFDLRDTRASFFLKELEPITVNEGYRPRLFIADYEPGHGYCGWDRRQELTVGVGEWVFNDVELVADESAWARYSNERDLDRVLSRVGFIGIRYAVDHGRKGVGATGVLGIDEFSYNLKSDPGASDTTR